MTNIRPGMAVHLVRMPARCTPLPQSPGMQGFGDYHISDYASLGDVGTVVGHELARSEEPLYQVKFKDCVFWLARENIEPTSPQGVTIEPEFVREDGFYWVKDEIDGWLAAQWKSVWCNDDRNGWFPVGSELPCDDIDFIEIGPHIEPPKDPDWLPESYYPSFSDHGRPIEILTKGGVQMAAELDIDDLDDGPEALFLLPNGDRLYWGAVKRWRYTDGKKP